MAGNLGRNEPCHCESGKKYKKCCLTTDLAADREAKAAAELQAAQEREAAKANREEETPFFEETIPIVAQAEFDLGFDPLVEKPKKKKTKAKRDKEEEAEQLWNHFGALHEPSPSDLESLLAKLAALPSEEEIPWPDVFRTCVGWKSCDVESVFRQIAEFAPHSKQSEISFFYWQAAELFANKKEKYGHLVKEVVENFSKLDETSYDIDCLSFIVQHLLDGGYIDEALSVSEKFLPVVKKDQTVFEWVASDYSESLFDLRIGRAIRDYSKNPDLTKDQIASTLSEGVEELIKKEFTTNLAQAIVSDNTDSSDWNHQTFNLFQKDDTDTRLYELLIFIAKQSWEKSKYPPEKLYPSLCRILEAAYKKLAARKKKNKNNFNLIDCLKPVNMNNVIDNSCYETFGINLPKIKSLLDAFTILNQNALDHELVKPEAAKKSEEKISDWIAKLDSVY